MKKQIKKMTGTELLRQKAEEFLKNQQSERSSYSAEVDILKLNHELSVHQIELEIQNKELMDAKKDMEIAVKKYTDLYDFASSGYLTVTREGQIVELNLSASRMLGKERRRLMQNMLGAYVTDDKKQTFYHFLNGIFESRPSKHVN
jgi:signal transduction histidine kinase